MAITDSGSVENEDTASDMGPEVFGKGETLMLSLEKKEKKRR